MRVVFMGLHPLMACRFMAAIAGAETWACSVIVDVHVPGILQIAFDAVFGVPFRLLRFSPSVSPPIRAVVFALLNALGQRLAWPASLFDSGKPPRFFCFGFFVRQRG